ncbi:MAG TPA: adenylate/guanylate cyclase domain-containing protein, partial [Acidimicrobiales bacterium]|nr:adenylate/guanylate cyclase domain-containing protein [Acidimicrobiales bacterium]
RVVKSTGDGALATFDGPARALYCAHGLRAALSEIGLRTRIGLHTGEIEPADDDVRGLAVHIAARVAARAAADEILCSRTVADLVLGSGIGFERRGIHQLKGVPGDWPLYAASTP